MISLVLGGARSGKSRIAEQMAHTTNLPLLYVATATALDTEMKERIAHHQQQRQTSQQNWQLRECPLYLATALREEIQQPQCILIDCLTLWLNNQLFRAPEQSFQNLFDDLIAAVQAPNKQAHLIFVANEVGLGIIPMGEISRKFVDEAGRLNQQLAAIADQVFFVAAGIPLTLKAATAVAGSEN